MRQSQLFGQTLRVAPANDLEIPSHALLERGGFIRSYPGGKFAYLPLGMRVLKNLENLYINAFKNDGGQEFSGDVLQLVESEVQSYRQLPRVLYRRTHLSGIKNSRYGLFGAETSPGLKFYWIHPKNSNERFPVSYMELERKILGPMETVFSCLEDYRAAQFSCYPIAEYVSFSWEEQSFLTDQICMNVYDEHVAEFIRVPPDPADALPLEKVRTPDCHTIDSLARFLNVHRNKTAKAVMFTATLKNGEEHFVFAVVRGDRDLSEYKLAKALKAQSMRPATEAEIRAAGAEPGYASPVGLKKGLVVVDEWIPISPNLVAGANETGYHLKNVNYGRDYQADIVTDITLAEIGDPCKECGWPYEPVSYLQTSCWSELDTESGPFFTDENGQEAALEITEIAFDLGRTLASIVDLKAHHDENGLIWPKELAPFDVHIIAIPGKQIDTLAAAEELYQALMDAGFSVLLDDRDERAGVKFNDADLIGCPVRVTIGERGLKESTVELKLRAATDKELVSLTKLVEKIKNL